MKPNLNCHSPGHGALPTSGGIDALDRLRSWQDMQPHRHELLALLRAG